MVRWRVALAGAGLVALAGCSGPVPAEPVPAATPTGSAQLIGVGTVLDDGDGPELCLGGVQTSYPPLCGGPALVNWTWPSAGVERANGVTWTDAAVVGTFDGRRFTVTKIVDPATVKPPEFPERDFSSPCPVPAGGWRAPDPSRATADDQELVFRAAEKLPTYGESWIDDLGDRSQDPAAVVVNVRVTEGVAEAEAALRRVWGGSLCVSKARHTQRELLRIADEVMKVDGVLGGGPSDDRVEVGVTYDDGRLQRKLDRKYGDDVVVLLSALQTYRG